MPSILDRIRRLLALYQAGHIPTLPQHEVHPDVPLGSRENYLYFTLPVCINFQRSSPAMWQSALKTYEDPETNYLFFPEPSTAAPPGKVRTDLLKHKLALQPNKHPEIWLAISRTLHDHFNDDPREIIRAADSDAGTLVRLLQIDQRDRLPYLHGPKLSNYWPFILSEYTDVTFKNSHKISIIPETHIIQCSVHLGLVPPDAKISQVETAWRDLFAKKRNNPYLFWKTKAHPRFILTKTAFGPYGGEVLIIRDLPKIHVFLEGIIDNQTNQKGLEIALKNISLP